MALFRPKQSLIPNAVGVSEVAVRELVPELDEHLSSFSVLHHQYCKHLWLSPEPQVWVHFLREQGAVVFTAVNAFADRIVVLGGVPASDPAEQASRSYLNHEPEGVYPYRVMAEHDLLHERVAALRLPLSIEAAQERGDVGTETLLRAVLDGVDLRMAQLEGLLRSGVLNEL